MAREIDEETLNQYFDGELPAEKREMVRLVLEGSPEARARLARLERTRAFVRLAAEDSARDLDADQLFASIQQGVREQADAGFGAPFGVLSGGDTPPIERWKVAVPAALVLAAAAALLLVVYGGRAKPDVAVSPPPSPPKVELEPPPGSEVEAVDFGANTGTVFAVKGAAGEPLAVVWLSDEEAAN